MRKFTLLIVCLLLIVAGFQARAFDTAPSVCRDTAYEDGIRYQFRDIPADWTSYWYVAADGEMTGNTFTADAITEYSPDASGIKVGEAVFGNADYSVILRGTADTEPCDPPPESTPEAPQCPAWAINGETGELFCKWDLPQATNQN